MSDTIFKQMGSVIKSAINNAKADLQTQINNIQPGAGAVLSVNGKVGSVSINATDVGAIGSTEKGAVSGVATLDSSGFVPVTQIPSLNYIQSSEKGATNGVATLSATGTLSMNQLPDGIGSGIFPVNREFADFDYTNSSPFTVNGELENSYMVQANWILNDEFLNIVPEGFNWNSVDSNDDGYSQVTLQLLPVSAVLTDYVGVRRTIYLRGFENTTRPFYVMAMTPTANAVILTVPVGAYGSRSVTVELTKNPLNDGLYWKCVTPDVAYGTPSLDGNAKILPNQIPSIHSQPEPAVVNTSTTLTVANVNTRIIQSTPTGNITITLPTGADLDSELYSSSFDMGVDWSVINLSAGASVTITQNSNHLYVGNGTIGAGTSALFRSRRVATNGWTTYRVG